MKTRVTSKQTMRTATLAALSVAVVGLLGGCAVGDSVSDSAKTSLPVAAVQISGTVYGGQQPIIGAAIQLYTVGTSGVASAATPLLAPGTTSQPGTGGFTLPSFSCASATQVYLVATGGSAGGGANSAISLMAAIGPCTGIVSTTHIKINELTTVAATTALAPFMTSVTQVGATGSNPAGLVNAFKAAQVLINTSTGDPGTTSGITLPITELYTLGDILAACVNSGGPATGACPQLFSATGATDTLGASVVISHNPGNAAIISLWSLPSTAPPYVPFFSARPNDFTVAVKYAGAELAGPYGIAIDAQGNAWVSNEAGKSVVKLPSLSPSFATTTYSSGGLLAPRGVSIDRSGNVWVANTGGNNIVELSSAGAVLSGAGFTGGGINTPVAIANDSAGNAWIANVAGNSVTELGATGTASGASPITNSLSTPTSLALDSTGRVAVANAGTGAVCLFSNAAVFQQCSSDGTLFGSTAVALSSAGNVAMAGSLTGSVVAGAFTLATNAGAVNAASPVSGGGLTLPTAVAYDGNGTAWFANTASISAFGGTGAITGSTGFGSLSAPAGIAVDNSGNIWTANAGDNSVSVFIGLATPVLTPIAATVGP